MKVLITESFPPAGLEVLASYDLEVDVKLSLGQTELCSIIHSYDALIVRSQTKVSSEVLSNARNLKIIARAGVGVDNIDIEAATKQGIIVMDVPSGNTISAAEHTFGLLIALSRNILQAHLSVKQKEWRRKDFLGVEIMGKVLGIIGLGRIGTEVAKRALAFGMKVLAYDPYLSDEFYQTKIKTLGIERVDLENLLKNSDYISLHAPLSSSTYHLLSQREFSIMKQGVRIINCARGGIIDEEALFENLKSGKKGILEMILTTASVNYVNTPWLIKERGIKVTESKTSRSEEFKSSFNK